MEGWYSRGYLPHFHSRYAIQHVTLHLSDSIPKNKLELLLESIKSRPPEKQDIFKRIRLEAIMDNGYGCCALRPWKVAGEIQRQLILHHDQRYHLLAWVIMPNHLHLLIQLKPAWSLSDVVSGWKKNSAVVVNEYLRSIEKKPLEPVWHHEYWDRYIRDEFHLQKVIKYIHDNPVKAGLAFRPENWRWSSARLYFPGSALLIWTLLLVSVVDTARCISAIALL